MLTVTEGPHENRRSAIARYDRRGARALIGSCFAVISLIVASQFALDLGPGLAALVAGLEAFCLLMTARAFLMATILVRSDRLIEREFVRTYQFRWEEVDRFSAETEVGGYLQPGRVVCAWLTDGRKVKFGTFYWRTRRDRNNVVQPNRAESIAIDLNGYLLRYRNGE
jgi:hypothetical protein